MTSRSFCLTGLLATLIAAAGCAAPTKVEPAIASTPAAVIFGSCPQKPAWPEAAKLEKRHGKVGLMFDIGPDSSVVGSKVMRTSGHADLDEAARLGIAKCKFKAATRNGIPVQGSADLDYVWVP